MKLEIWNNKIKEKRKKTDFRTFLKEIASNFPLNFYKNSWFVSIIPNDSNVKKILDFEKFNELRDSLISFGEIYDFNKIFFQNFGKLFLEIPHPNIIDFWENENSKFWYSIYASKNIYLSFEIGWCENVLYSLSVKQSSINVFNSVAIRGNCENIYMTLSSTNSYKIFYSKFINNSSNIWFSQNMIWCEECILCEWLINKKYHIWNIEYEKDKYFIEKSFILNKKDKYNEYYKNLKNIGKNIWSQDIIWIWTINSQNIDNWYFVNNVKNWRNLLFVSGTLDEEMYDTMTAWLDISSDFYGCFDVWISNNIYLSQHIWLSSNIYYSYNLLWCSFCIWCIWLKNKSYCILNKQYTQDERYEMANKIFAQMDEQWILGEMFPWDLNPFYFNDTVAYLIDNSFTREEIINQWYMRRDESIKVDIPEWMEIVETKDLDISNYDESILKKVIKDEQWNIYRIVKMEYDFLKKYNLPLPNLHWLDRIKIHFKWLNDIK